MPVTCTNYKLKCGGCPLLNQPYPDQLKHKQQLEQRLLGRFAPVSPVLGQAEPWHYRHLCHRAAWTTDMRHLCSGHPPRAAVYGLLAAGYRH